MNLPVLLNGTLYDVEVWDVPDVCPFCAFGESWDCESCPRLNTKEAYLLCSIFDSLEDGYHFFVKHEK